MQLARRGARSEPPRRDPDAARAIASALRAAGVHEVDAGDRRRAEFSSDASNYRVPPVAVVFPRDADDVAATLSVARASGTALTCRGAGTSIAGNSIGPGIVVDFSRHMNRVLAVDPDTATAHVQPGAVLDSITAASAPFGLRYGPDPSTHARATIGGTLGNNACGARALRFGRAADNVVDLELLTASGEAVTARRMGSAGLASAGLASAGLASAGGPARDLAAVVARHGDTIRREFGRFGRQISGYSLEHLLPENGADVARFLAGSEGTLAIITEATIRLVRPPREVALVVLGYSDIAEAAEAAAGVLHHLPTAVEGLDARLVDSVRRRGSALPDLPAGNGWLLVEVAGDTAAEASAAAARVTADARAGGVAVLSGVVAAALWRVREDGAGLAGRTIAGAPAWPGWEDAAVPPSALGAYLRDFAALLREHRLEGLVYGHFGEGCVHARLDFPLEVAPQKYRAFVVAAAQLVARYGGSMSGEHGDGRARSELLGYMYSPDALGAFAEVKRAFDPTNLLNPGVIVDPAPLDADLRLGSARPLRIDLGFAYAHDGGDFVQAVHRCVGVGKCRADNRPSGGVMCPSYLATGDEKDSTRGRARVLQELANGSLVDSFRSDAVAEALDLCLACKGCASDCPAGVDMATYKAEALHQRYRGRVRPRSHYALGRLPTTARIASRAPRAVNAALGVAGVAAAVKWGAGIDPRRALPPFAARTFRQWFCEQPQPDGVPVTLWVDTFTNHFTPDVGKAAVRVLNEAGYSVSIVSPAVCCGLTLISTGQLDAARRAIRRSLAALEPALDARTPIVGLEPSCTAVLRRDAQELLPNDERARDAAALTRTLAEHLELTATWAPPDLAGVRAVAQPHCHQHAVMGWDADARLLRRAGASITELGGCCGLAGNFGFERGHFEVSAMIAEQTLLPAARTCGPDDVVLADGFSCRTQLDELANVRAVHLAELLSQAMTSAGRHV
jgi:FAD/FMN-containing dehydrogenase/Fe-S oxidoreductase